MNSPHYQVTPLGYFNVMLLGAASNKERNGIPGAQMVHH